jgi:hypothetical protein
MSLVDGSAFVVYQGEFLRRACRSSLVRPTVAYQVTVMAWQAISNGTVRSTARAVRVTGLAGAEDLLRVLYRCFNGPS